MFLNFAGHVKIGNSLSRRKVRNPVLTEFNTIARGNVGGRLQLSVKIL